MASCFEIYEGDKLAELINTNAPERCLNCKSQNIIGPYKYLDTGFRISGWTPVRQQAFVCVDCRYTMLFAREGHEERILKELLKKQAENE